MTIVGWKDCQLGDVITLQRGFDLPVQDRKLGNVPIVSSSGITGTHSEAKATGPGVVTGRYGTIGQVFYINRDFWPLNTTLYVKDFKGNDPLFISYLLRTIDFESHNDKSSVPGVNRNHLHTIKVSLPPVPEQRIIADILGSLDDKIELNNQMNKALDALSKAIFKSWFVDFDPVQAKAEGHKPEGMNDATASLFPSAFIESILGPIPEGWTISEIGKEVEVVGGSTPSTQEMAYWEDGEFYWVTPKDLSKLKSPILLDTERKITELGVKQISSGQLPVDTVLLSSRAPVGYIALAKVPVSINQGFIAMKCVKDLSPYFVMNWVYSTLEEIKARATGTTFAEISKSVFRPIKVIVPNPSIIQSFNDIVKPIYDRIAENEQNISSLTNICGLLLPRLISGKLRVSDLPKEAATS